MNGGVGDVSVGVDVVGVGVRGGVYVCVIGVDVAGSVCVCVDGGADVGGDVARVCVIVLAKASANKSQPLLLRWRPSFQNRLWSISPEPFIQQPAFPTYKNPSS